MTTNHSTFSSSVFDLAFDIAIIVNNGFEVFDVRGRSESGLWKGWWPGWWHPCRHPSRRVSAVVPVSRIQGIALHNVESLVSFHDVTKA